MIRVLESILVDADDNIRYQRMAGTSSDTKPTAGVANGSLFEEADTGKTYIYNEDGAEWTEYAAGGGGGGGGITIHICSQEEVSQGLPNIQNPDEKTIYLVPTGETGGNLYNEYIWVNNAWEPFGSGEIDLSGYVPYTTYPSNAGTYSLQVTTSGGTATYSWVSIPAANGVSF